MPSTPTPSKAWAALVTRPDYLPGLLVLHRTLTAVSTYPLVVLVTASLPEHHRNIIRGQGMAVVEIDHLQPADGAHAGFEAKFARFHDTWTKLQVFGVEAFDRLILIDADTLFLRGMDELFDMDMPEDWIAAAPACTCNPFKFPHYPSDWTPENCSLSRHPRPTTLSDDLQPRADGPRTAHLLNSGVVVLHPRRALMEKLEHHLNTSPTIAQAQFPDQDVLAEVFRDKWRVLPWWTNSLKTERAVHTHFWDDGEVRLLHYILEKPWSKRPDGLAPRANIAPTTDHTALPPALIEAVRTAGPQPSLTDYDLVHGWWWIVYEDLLEELKRDSALDWEEIDKWVTR